MRITASPQLLAHLPIDRRARTPMHRQIYDGVRRAILDGALRPGQRVPATRVLASELEVSRLTILVAFDQLLHEGYLVGRVGSGTFVSDTLPAAARRAPGARATAVKERPPRARDDGGIRPFRASLPALDEFPHAAWSRIVARHARSLAPIHMAYGDPAGLGALRAAIADHLRTARAVRCEAEQIMIVSGSQAALRLCAAVLLRPGHRVAVEDPGYTGAYTALVSTGAALAPTRVDEHGIDVGALETHRRAGGPIRAVCVTPSHQHPLGAPMSATRRMALLDWAHRTDAWVLEDDYDSEYRYVSRPLGALQGMDTHGRVIYLGTFSKVLFPALRVGYLVVPPSLWSAFVAEREAVDVFSSTLYQLALAEFLRDGHFARHLRRMRTVYGRRRDALLEGLARHCGDRLEVHNADAGLHVSTMLPKSVDDVAVVRRMAARGLSATALSTCYLGDERRSGLLLGFGGFDERSLLAATRTLGLALRDRD
jgi:GntR family transcriptional regulator/MocR family aminotransferase